MFVQVIQGRTSDAEGTRSAMDRWMQDLRPGSIGWLGSTVGVADDGRFVAVARFESAEAADRNSERPEQSRWWEETQEEPPEMHGDDGCVGGVHQRREVGILAHSG